MQPPRHHFLAGSVLAGDEDVGVGRRDVGDQFQHRLHGGGRRHEVRGRAQFAPPLGIGEPAAEPAGLAKLHLGAQRGHQSVVVPRFLDVVASAPAHGLDRTFDTAPGGHGDDGERGVEFPQGAQEVHAFAAGGGVAGVVEVHQHAVEIAGGGHFQHFVGRMRGQHGHARALQQQAQGLEDVRLIIRNEDRGLARLGQWLLRDAPLAPEQRRAFGGKAFCLPYAPKGALRTPAAVAIGSAVGVPARPYNRDGPWGRGHLALAMRRQAHWFEGEVGHARLSARARARCPRPQGPSLAVAARGPPAHRFYGAGCAATTAHAEHQAE